MTDSPIREQTYANHVRRLPPLYWAGVAALLVQLAAAVALLATRQWLAGAAALGGALGGSAAIYFARSNALVVQTRLVCLEERLRLERLLPEDLRPRVAAMTVDQLVATRFAADSEVADLVRAVWAEGLTGRGAIKRRIRTWRADWNRV